MIIVHIARKPIDGSVAANVLKHGVGAIGIDACRVATVEAISGRVRTHSDGWGMGDGIDDYEQHPNGRWPANVILAHRPGCQPKGTQQFKHRGGAPLPEPKQNSTPTFTSRAYTSTSLHFDAEGMETVEVWDCVEDCPVRALNLQSGVTKGAVRQPTGKAVYSTEGTAMTWNQNAVKDTTVRGFADEGGVSRYFKTIREDEPQEPTPDTGYTRTTHPSAVSRPKNE